MVIASTRQAAMQAHLLPRLLQRFRGGQCAADEALVQPQVLFPIVIISIVDVRAETVTGGRRRCGRRAWRGWHEEWESIRRGWRKRCHGGVLGLGVVEPYLWCTGRNHAGRSPSPLVLRIILLWQSRGGRWRRSGQWSTTPAKTIRCPLTLGELCPQSA